MKKMSAIRELLNMAEFRSLTECLLDCQFGSWVETLGEEARAGTGAGEGGGEGRLTRSGDKVTISRLSGGCWGRSHQLSCSYWDTCDEDTCADCTYWLHTLSCSLRMLATVLCATLE